MTFLGRSTVASPHGRVLAQLSDRPDDSAVVAVDRSVVLEARRDHPFLADLRADLFRE